MDASFFLSLIPCFRATERRTSFRTVKTTNNYITAMWCWNERTTDEANPYPMILYSVVWLSALQHWGQGGYCNNNSTGCIRVLELWRGSDPPVLCGTTACRYVRTYVRASVP